ncbi:MAG: twin-arginine translocation signal domain-containing protein, partial [Candidatus Binataceae bacterium]
MVVFVKQFANGRPSARDITLISRRDFLKGIGTAGAVILAPWAAGCGGGTETPQGAQNSVGAPAPGSDTYRSAAKAGFEVLVKQYKTPDIFAGSFW